MTNLRKVDAKRVHVQAVEKTGEALAKPRQALVHQLEVHDVGLQIGHRVCQFRKLRLQSVDGGGGLRGMSSARAAGAV